MAKHRIPNITMSQMLLILAFVLFGVFTFLQLMRREGMEIPGVSSKKKEEKINDIMLPK